MNRSLSLASIVLGAALGLVTLFASAAASANETWSTEPPSRVARLSYTQGDVSLQAVDEDEWSAAEVNRPLTTGDRLWTEQDGRAEVQIGDAAIRMSSETGFYFLELDDNSVRLRMTAGVMNVRVRELHENDSFEIETPNLDVALLRPGNYRLEVNDAGDATVLKVSSGEAETTAGNGQTIIVHAQQQATFNGIERLAADIGTLGAPDSFDAWSLERDRRDESARSARYVSPDVVGYEDLDDHGTWQTVPEYGYVWYPTTVAVGWAPYRFGRWSWIFPWGWTWVDNEPWGYAPFHYGRWATVGGRWCWVPGPRHARPIFAPGDSHLRPVGPRPVRPSPGDRSQWADSRHGDPSRGPDNQGRSSFAGDSDRAGSLNPRRGADGRSESDPSQKTPPREWRTVPRNPDGNRVTSMDHQNSRDATDRQIRRDTSFATSPSWRDRAERDRPQEPRPQSNPMQPRMQVAPPRMPDAQPRLREAPSQVEHTPRYVISRPEVRRPEPVRAPVAQPAPMAQPQQPRPIASRPEVRQPEPARAQPRAPDAGDRRATDGRRPGERDR